MQLVTLKLVTVVGEAIIMDDIAERGMKLGASGHTMTEVMGHGSRSARNVATAGGAKTIKLEFVVSERVAHDIMAFVAEQYLEHYAIIAWLSDVSVMRGEEYVRE